MSMVADDGSEDIDAEWVLDYRHAVKKMGVREHGRCKSGFFFTVPNFDAYNKIFIDRKRHPHGIKMPTSPFGRKNRPLWAGRPQFPGEAPTNSSNYMWRDYDDLLFIYPFAIRSLKELVGVNKNRKRVWSGDGEEDAHILDRIPDDLLDAVAKHFNYSGGFSMKSDFTHDSIWSEFTL